MAWQCKILLYQQACFLLEYKGQHRKVNTGPYTMSSSVVPFRLDVPPYHRSATVYPKKYAHGFALLCFVVVIHWLIFQYPSGLLHWHCGNLTIAPVPAKQPWWIWINTSCEFIMNDCITTTKQSTTKPCAYFLGYTVTCHGVRMWHSTGDHSHALWLETKHYSTTVVITTINDIQHHTDGLVQDCSKYGILAM